VAGRGLETRALDGYYFLLIVQRIIDKINKPNIPAFCCATPCVIVYRYQHSVGPCYLHLQCRYTTWNIMKKGAANSSETLAPIHQCTHYHIQEE